MLEVHQSSDDDSYQEEDNLRIIYQNEQKEDIIIYKNNKLYLEKFVFLLNGKLNDINEMKKIIILYINN